MATTDIGRAVPLLRGEYDPAQTYELNDIVSLNGSLYWHYSHEVTTNVAPQATSTWKVVLSLTDAEGYIARAETAAEEAESAKDDAVTAKTAAETASATATGASEAATAAKDDAVTARNAAQTAETGAVEAKNAAVSAKDEAVTAASSAGTSATNASNSAGTAEYYAENAETAAETATTKAGEASASATTASSAATTATEAKNTAVSSATTATTKAGEASTSATSAASSAATAQAVKDSIPEDYSELSEDVGDLKTQFDDAIGSPDETITSLENYELIQGFISDENVWRYITTSPARYIIIPIERPGGDFSIKAQDGHTAYFAFLSSYTTPTEVGEIPSFCSSPYDTRKAISGTAGGRTETGTVPDDAKYLYVAIVTSSGTNIAPSTFGLTIPGIKGSLTEQISDIENDLTDIENGLIGSSPLPLGSWVFGTVNASKGNITTSSTSIATINLIDISDNILTLFTDDQHKFRVYGWDTEDQYQGFWKNDGSGYSISGSAINHVFSEVPVQQLLDAGTQKVRIVLVRTDNEAIGTYDGSSFKFVVVNTSRYNKESIESIQASLNTVVSPYNHGVFMINKADYSTWYSGLQTTYGGFGKDTQYSEVISAFDALVRSYPKYVTSNDLDTISGTYTVTETVEDEHGEETPVTHEESYSYTIYEYVFKSDHKTDTLCAEKVPRIYMDGSIHGFEKSSTYGLYYFMKDICENWDKNESLRNLRSHVEFHIIPVVNPWGFDNYEYVNANQVNINRNFPSKNWAPVVDPEHPGNNTGAIPFDQHETRIIRDWLLAGRDDMLMYFNGHTAGAVVTRPAEMNSCITRNDGDEYYNKMIKVFCDHIDKQTVAIPAMYPNIAAGFDNPESPYYDPNVSKDMYGTINLRSDDSVKIGTASAWAMSYGKMLAMTLETFNGIWLNTKYAASEILTPYSSDALKLNSEIIGNLVLQILSEYAPH